MVIRAVFSSAYTALRTRNQMAMSRSPRPTTTSPITAPLRNAVFSPLSSPVRAPLAVRAEAYVAVFMPKNPESPENSPPVRNANGTHGFCTSSTYAMNENIMASTMNTMPTTLYCCLRYAIAPFLTCDAISFIRSVPSSSFIMVRKKYHAIPNATMLATGISQKTNGMLFINI